MSIAEKAPKPYHTGRFAGRLGAFHDMEMQPGYVARGHIMSDEQMREQYRPLPTSFVHVTHLEDGPELNAIRAMTAISHTALVERSGLQQQKVDYSRPCQWPHCECMTETGVNCKAGLTRGVTFAEMDYSEIERQVMAAEYSDRALAFQALFGDALAPVMEELRHVIFDDEETRAFDQREQARQGDGVRDGRSRHEMLKETHVVVGDHPPERRQCWPDTGEGD